MSRGGETPIVPPPATTPSHSKSVHLVGGPRLPVSAFIHGQTAQFSARLSFAVASCKQFALWPFTLCPGLLPLLSLSLFALKSQRSTVHSHSQATGSQHFSLRRIIFVLCFKLTAARFPLKLIRFSAGISKEKRATVLAACHPTTPECHPPFAQCLVTFPLPHWTKIFITFYKENESVYRRKGSCFWSLNQNRYTFGSICFIGQHLMGRKKLDL